MEISARLLTRQPSDGLARRECSSAHSSGDNVRHLRSPIGPKISEGRSFEKNP